MNNIEKKKELNEEEKKALEKWHEKRADLYSVAVAAIFVAYLFGFRFSTATGLVEGIATLFAAFLGLFMFLAIGRVVYDIGLHESVFKNKTNKVVMVAVHYGSLAVLCWFVENIICKS